MSRHTRIAPIVLTPLLAVAMACQPDEAAISEPVAQKETSLTARGQPTSVERLVLDGEMVPNPFICPDVTIDTEINGQIVLQTWTSGVPFEDETLLKSQDNLFITWTNPETGASATSHQTTAGEFLIDDFRVVEVTNNGGLRVTSPGEGIVVQDLGHTKVTIDFSVDPPEVTFESHGRSVGSISEQVC